MSKRKTKMQKLSCENRLLKAENKKYSSQLNEVAFDLKINKELVKSLDRRNGRTSSLFEKALSSAKQENKNLHDENKKLEKMLKDDSTYFYMLVAVFIIQWVLIAIIN